MTSCLFYWSSWLSEILLITRRTQQGLLPCTQARNGEKRDFKQVSTLEEKYAVFVSVNGCCLLVRSKNLVWVYFEFKHGYRSCSWWAIIHGNASELSWQLLESNKITGKVKIKSAAEWLRQARLFQNVSVKSDYLTLNSESEPATAYCSFFHVINHLKLSKNS